MPRRTQHSFAAGIISEESRGRSDIARYGIGVADFRNFTPKAPGDYEKRPGTEYVGEEFIPEGDVSRPVVLVDFDYGTEQSYCLEFGHHYMAPIKDGARILQSPVNITALSWSSGNPIEITVASDIYPMNGDLITIDGIVGGASSLNGQTFKCMAVETLQPAEYPGTFVSDKTENKYEPRIYSAEFGGAPTNHDWSVGPDQWMRVEATNAFPGWDYFAGYYLIEVVATQFVDLAASVSSGNDAMSFCWFGNDYVPSPAYPSPYPAVGSMWKVEPNKFTLVRDDDTIDPGSYTSGGTATRFYREPTPYHADDLRYLQWSQTADEMTFTLRGDVRSYPIFRLTRNDHDDWVRSWYKNEPSIDKPTGLAIVGGNGSGYNWLVTAISRETGEESLPAIISGANPLTAGTAKLTWDNNPDAIRHNVYIERTPEDGRIGFADVSDSDAFRQDAAIAAEFDLQPPASAPYPFALAMQQPRSNTYFAERLWFGGTSDKKQSVFASRIDVYESFSVSIPVVASDAIEREISVRSMAEIRHLVPADELLVFTASAVYGVEGGQGGTISPGGIGFPLKDFEGASIVRPLTIKSATLYITDEGQRVIDLGYELEADSLVGKDRTMLTDGLLAQKVFTDWDYAKVPNAIIWAIQDDGGMLSLTYKREHDVWGWARHDTIGSYESVVAIRESFETGVYIAVQRTVDGVAKRFIERMDQTSVTLRDPRDARFLDCALSYDEPNDITFDVAQTNPLRIELGVDPTTLDPAYAVDDKIDLEILTRNSRNKIVPHVYSNGRYLVKTVGVTWLELKEDEIAAVDQVDFDAVELLDASGNLVHIESSNVRKCVDAVGGMEHFANEEVDALIDGRAYKGDEESWLTVSATGTIALPGAGPTKMWASRVRLGWRIVSDFQSLPPDVRTNEFSSLKGLQVKVSKVHLELLASRGGKVGASFDDFLNPITYYTDEDLGEEMNLFTGGFDTTIEGRWGRGQYVLRHDDALPFHVLSSTEDLDVGDPE